jgi:hypothetical protein
MKCKTCGKEVVHYWVTGKPYCDVHCENKDSDYDIVSDFNKFFGFNK